MERCQLGAAIVNPVEVTHDRIMEILNKANFEAYATEIGMVLEEISFMLKNMKGLLMELSISPLLGAMAAGTGACKICLHGI